MLVVLVQVLRNQFQAVGASGHQGRVVAVGTEVPDNIEEIQNPKAWLERNILNRRYRETAEQAIQGNS